MAKAKGTGQEVKGGAHTFAFYLVPCAFLFVLALVLRLLVWRWRAFYPLSGDENEYFNQALTLLRDHRYAELQFMRPPLYTAFLSASMYLLDSLVQRVRLVQALISALTVLPMYALATGIRGQGTGDRGQGTGDRGQGTGVRGQEAETQTGDRSQGSGVRGQKLKTQNSKLKTYAGAVLLVGLNYTLAFHATELLSETLFVFLFTSALALLLYPRAADESRRRLLLRAGSAGALFGLTTLTRSITLIFIPLFALCLLNDQTGAGIRPKMRAAALPICVFMLAFGLVVLPWTIRNYATYGALIIVDTTGAENLWLDNNFAQATPADPLGREAAKRTLYALNDDRAARQRLGSANGIAQVAAHPRDFAFKTWREAQKFFALEYFDDMRERRAIWVPPAEVGLRLVLGDGLWLLMLCAGIGGLWRAGDRGQGTGDRGQGTGEDEARGVVIRRGTSRVRPLLGVRALFGLWALYIFVTNIVFHVELRYRLPLYPVLIPFAALFLTHERATRDQRGKANDKSSLVVGRWSLIVGRLRRAAAPAALVAACLALTLLHRNYIAESWMLAGKHLNLWQAERALAVGDAAQARAFAQRALAWDAESALAQVALARAALQRGDDAAASSALDAATRAVRAHPQPHLLRGALLRAHGDLKGACAELLKYEAGSLQDLQGWAWDTFAPFALPPSDLHVGDGLDLGFVRGFYATEQASFRWSSAAAQLRITLPAQAQQLEITLNAGRPAGVAPPVVVVLADGQELGRITPTNDWRTYRVPISAAPRQVIITLRSDTFRPRDADRTSGDVRDLGVQVRDVAGTGDRGQGTGDRGQNIAAVFPTRWHF